MTIPRLFLLVFTMALVSGCDTPGSSTPAGGALDGVSQDTSNPGDVGTKFDVADGAFVDVAQDTAAGTTLCFSHRSCVALECAGASAEDQAGCVAAAVSTCGLGDDAEAIAADAVLSCALDNGCALNPSPCSVTECLSEEIECRTGGTLGSGTCSDLLSCSQTCGSDPDPIQCVRDCSTQVSQIAHEQSYAAELCIFDSCADDPSVSCTEAALAPGGACAGICQ